jgi:hypothetical protein
MPSMAKTIHKKGKDARDFRKWFREWMVKTGRPVDTDPFDPRHKYDYWGAWKAGAKPTWQPEHKQMRWPDRFKTDKK